MARRLDYGRVADIVREEIRAAGYNPNSCIMAARLTTMALRRLGVDAEAMAVKIDAFSPAYVEMMRHAGGSPSPEDFAEYSARGAWRVTLSDEEAKPGVHDNRDGGYQGHVVTLAERRKWMLDPTLSQVARPEKNLVIDPPCAWPIDWREAREGGVLLSGSNGTLLFYQFLPKRRDFVLAQDWRAEDWRRTVQLGDLNRILTRIQKETLCRV